MNRRLFASYFILQTSKWLFLRKCFHEFFLIPLLSVLFPADCPACLQPLGRFHLAGICLNCWTSIKLIRKPYCFKCGIPLKPKSSIPSKLEVDRNKGLACNRCRSKKYQFAFARSLGEYEGSLREIIHYYKFGRKSYLSEPLADLMMKTLDIKNIFGNIDVIIAVPLHRKRRKERGFNQAYLIARRLGNKLHIRVEGRVLLRIKKSMPQMDLPAHQRERNVMGAFKVMKAKRIRGKRILLIDDVMTTGATVNECAGALMKAGSKDVCVLTIAYTPASRREQFRF